MRAVHSCNSWFIHVRWCWLEKSGGAMMLDEFPVLGRPTDLDNYRARAYCACSTE